MRFTQNKRLQMLYIHFLNLKIILETIFRVSRKELNRKTGNSPGSAVVTAKKTSHYQRPGQVPLGH